MKRILLFLVLFNLTLSAEEYSEKFIIGYSVKKRPIELHKFGYGKQVIMIIAGIHGNEENTSKTAYFLIDYFEKEKIKVVDSKSVWIIPELNPDGIARGRRLNDNNVDLNRNFETDNWKPKVIFYNNILSAGTKPFSEPETKCIRDLIERTKSENTIVVLSLHSSGNAIIPGDNSRFNKELLSILYDGSDYIFTDIGYKTTGDLTSWLSSKQKIASLTVEFKTKTEMDNEEMLKISSLLMNIDFEKKIYGAGIDILDLFTSNDEKLMNSLAKNLPGRISENIKSANPKIFMDYFNSCKDRDDLLLLVNKSNMLPSDYIPTDLVTLTTKEIPTSKGSFMLRKEILADLKDMINDAGKDGVRLSVISAYRSYATQKAVFNDWKVKLGEKEASRVSAVAGASQHQLGTAIDFNSLSDSFERSKESIWLHENAFKYGFIISYPKNQEEITGYKFEPWHYRYLGKEAAFLVYSYFDNSMEIFLNWYWQKNDEK